MSPGSVVWRTSSQLCSSEQRHSPEDSTTWCLRQNHGTLRSTSRSPTREMQSSWQNREGKILMEISKTWKKNEKRHINVLELLTILKALKRLPDTIRVIRLKSDNTTALSYIRLLSGRVIALHNIARQIFKICLRRGLTLIPEYIQGKKNTHADALSRLRQLPVTTQLKRMIGKDHLLFSTPNAIRYALIVPSPKTILTPDWKAHFLRPILMKDCSSWITIPTAPLQPHREWPAYIKKSKRLIAFFFEL